MILISRIFEPRNEEWNGGDAFEAGLRFCAERVQLVFVLIQNANLNIYLSALSQLQGAKGEGIAAWFNGLGLVKVFLFSFSFIVFLRGSFA